MELNLINILLTITSIPIIWMFTGIHIYLLLKFMGIKTIVGTPNTLKNAIGINGGFLLFIIFLTVYIPNFKSKS
jgi:hypothetical protein